MSERGDTSVDVARADGDFVVRISRKTVMRVLFVLGLLGAAGGGYLVGEHVSSKRTTACYEKITICYKDLGNALESENKLRKAKAVSAVPTPTGDTGAEARRAQHAPSSDPRKGPNIPPLNPNAATPGAAPGIETPVAAPATPAAPRAEGKRKPASEWDDSADRAAIRRLLR